MPELLVGDALLSRAEAALAVAPPDALGVEFVDPADPLCGVASTVGGLAVTPAPTLHGAALPRPGDQRPYPEADSTKGAHRP